MSVLQKILNQWDMDQRSFLAGAICLGLLTVFGVMVQAAVKLTR